MGPGWRAACEWGLPQVGRRVKPERLLVLRVPARVEHRSVSAKPEIAIYQKRLPALK